MLVRIFTIMVVCTLVIFLVFWLMTGGISRGIKTAQSLNNPLGFLRGNATGSTITLPWHPDTSSFGADLGTDFSNENTADITAPGVNADAAAPGTQRQDIFVDPQNQYTNPVVQTSEARTFGSPSPHRSEVTFDGYETSADSPANEYVRLRASYGATSPVVLAGWSLQSVVTGTRAMIPPAAPAFVSGTLNNVASVTLPPSGSITITTGISPVGVSFQENMCTGYLAELQNFTPPLDTDCPVPADSMPLTPENIQIYGDSCIDYMRSVAPCHFPGKDATPNITPTCRNFTINQLSYNGCVYAHRNDANFTKTSWRIYLSSATKLWRPTHDIIRLLDEQGRTVDVLTY